MIGKILAGKYKVLSLLGSGGMGQVYCCQRIELGGEVAIKILTNQISDKELLHEARAAGISNHPNICKVFDYFEEDGKSFLVMEKLEGLDLEAIIQFKRGKSEPFSFRLMFTIIREAAQALEHAHKSVLHRDIKPANIFLTFDGEIKVLDFGIAHFMHKNQEASLNACTDAYSSPELWVHGKYDSSLYDSTNDIYSLGLIFYELFHLKQAFNDKPTTQPLKLSNELTEVPPGFEELFAKWVHPVKSDRFKSAKDLLQSLSTLYPDDFNMKHEVIQELEKIKFGKHRNQTSKQTHFEQSSYRSKVITKDNMWPLIASFIMVLSALLGADFYFNADKTHKLHEENVEIIKKKTLSRGIASPK